MAIFNASGHCGRHADCVVRFHEIVIREIQRDRSFKVFKLLAESVREPGQAAAVHPQRVILLFNVRRGNPATSGIPVTTVFSTFTTSAGLYRTAAGAAHYRAG